MQHVFLCKLENRREDFFLAGEVGVERARRAVCRPRDVDQPSIEIPQALEHFSRRRNQRGTSPEATLGSRWLTQQRRPRHRRGRVRVVVLGGNVDHVHSYTSPSPKCSLLGEMKGRSHSPAHQSGPLSLRRLRMGSVRGQPRSSALLLDVPDKGIYTGAALGERGLRLHRRSTCGVL
jgi:hypothetical protein